MNEHTLKNIIEAILMAAGEPIALERLLSLLPEAKRPSKDLLRATLGELSHDYQERSLELCELGSGYAIRVRSEYAEWVQPLWAEKPAKPSRAFLETLAIIAYRQPITRGEIEKIRGVAVSSNIIKNLLDRQWIRIVGYRDFPGKPSLFGTTKIFLDHFSLKSLDGLPPLSEILDLDETAQQLELAIEGKSREIQVDTSLELFSDSPTSLSSTETKADDECKDLAMET